MHDLEHVTVRERRGLMLGARHDVAVTLHRYGPARQVEELDQPADRDALGDFVRLAIDLKVHAHPSSVRGSWFGRGVGATSVRSAQIARNRRAFSR
jgi:hypothetical protein